MKNVFAFYKVFKEVLVAARPACLLAEKSKSHFDLKTTARLMANNCTRQSVFVFPANLVAARRE